MRGARPPCPGGPKGASVNIAIVDDSDADAQSLTGYLEAFEAERHAGLEVERYRDASSFLKSDTSRFSLVILDIDMPGLSGMEAAHLLRSVDPAIQIMFMTTMPQYALESYEVEAVDYVLKPVAYAAFALKLSKALLRVERASQDVIVVKTAEGVFSLSPWEVTYVESQGHYLVYHTPERTLRARETMTAAEKRLEPVGFVRCNSYYLVNLRSVSSITGSDVTVGNDVLRMSRSRRRAFMDAFARFSGSAW